MAVVSCLTGMMVKKHPTLDIWCRDDGAVLLPRAGWVYGSFRERQKENTRKWKLKHPGYWRKYLNNEVA